MKVVAMLLAGGAGTRLTVLSEKRAKPAVPFAGKFRIIDFTLSNCVNSGIFTVGVLTQYRPHSLQEHIGIGKPWDLDRARGGVRLLPPYEGRSGQHWYLGTAHAVEQNLDFIDSQGADTVLILSGDHIYKMDYSPMLEQHQASGADLTIAVMEVPLEETDRFGIMEVDGEGRVVAFYEKPKEKDKGNLASMGIYVFDRRAMERYLMEGDTPRADFGKHVIPAMVAAREKVYSYRFQGYWVDVGTIDSYWATNLELTRAHPPLDLHDTAWPILTRSEERPAVKIGPQARVQQSLVSNGCVIRGVVSSSVLSPGVHVSPGAVVQNSVVMNDVWIGPGARLDRVVVDKDVVVGAGAVLGTGDASQPNRQLPALLATGITVVGKGTRIPEGCVVGRNVLINSDRDREHFPEDLVVADGETV
ncbi:MAG TPA: glucose-1-phosphate adenylyltransferase [Candidatus Nitrosotenuis sp.]|nr:glucose-1-phosphate adenylyltransferase [Candidatus Nitrosotenuis sp.]